MGYHRAGFDVVGVDLDPQPDYPFRFLQRDFRTLDPDVIAQRFDAIHLSPPCQAFTRMRSMHLEHSHPDYLDEARALAVATGLPYVIENVEGAPLQDPVRLCGSSFGLRVRRHRLFETNFPLVAPPCDHAWQNESKLFSRYQSVGRGGPYMSGTAPVQGNNGQLTMPAQQELAAIKRAMDTPWMTRRRSVTESIPPAYTEYIGARMRNWILDQELQDELRTFDVD